MPRKSWYKANPEAFKKYKRKQREKERKDPIGTARKRMKYKLKYEYGITLEQFEQMLLQQNGVCAICRQPEAVRNNGKLVRLSVDHNHNTGEVRALLCSFCNPAVGWVREDPLIARALAAYLETFNAPIEPGRQLTK